MATAITYREGDRVIVIDAAPANASKLGDILTIKYKKPGAATYQFKEVAYRLLPKRFKYYDGPGRDLPDYDGWVNGETAEAAIVFFNDRNRLDYVKEKLILKTHISVNQAVRMIQNIELSGGSIKQACHRAILEQWAKEQKNMGELDDVRYDAIMNDIACEFDYIEASLEDQALIAANAAMKNAEAVSKTCKEIYENLKQEKDPFAMKIETKHYLNDKELSSMTTEERIALISETEAHIEKLQSVKTESKLVAAEIKKAQAFLFAAVELFDKE